MTQRVDPWRFTGKVLENLLSRGIPQQPPCPPIPWAPLAKPLAQCRVALLSTAGISQLGDAPFDMEYERRNPTRGDSSWRRHDPRPVPGRRNRRNVQHDAGGAQRPGLRR